MLPLLVLLVLLNLVPLLVLLALLGLLDALWLRLYFSFLLLLLFLVLRLLLGVGRNAYSHQRRADYSRHHYPVQDTNPHGKPPSVIRSLHGVWLMKSIHEEHNK